MLKGDKSLGFFFQNLFQEQKSPWLPYSPYVSKFTDTTDPAKDDTDDYEVDDDTFRKRQDFSYPPPVYSGTDSVMGSANQVKMRNGPYKVSIDRNPDSYRIGPAVSSRLQLTPDTDPNPDSYHLQPKKMPKMVKKKKSLMLEQPMIYDAEPPKPRSMYQSSDEEPEYHTRDRYTRPRKPYQPKYNTLQYANQYEEEVPIRFPTEYMINNDQNYQHSDRTLLPRRQQELKKLRQQQQQQQQQPQQQQQQNYQQQQQQPQSQQQNRPYKNFNAYNYQNPGGIIVFFTHDFLGYR